MGHTAGMFPFFGKKPEKKEATASVPLVFYNTLSRKKEPFTPIRGRKVKMYTCGPTVYDFVTIGNLRTYIFADVLRRTLEYRGYDVKQVMNITDLGHLVGDADEGEDKMTAGLKREGMELSLENMKMLAARYTEAFIADLKELNIELPFAFPRASEHIPEQIAFIQSLFDKGYAYAVSDGVYFDTGKFPGYGILGGTSVSSSHARIEANQEKRHPQDFALWKSDSTLGWESPWGKGFPGWHIECTAMAVKYLGTSFDIHTGGIDLAPIHHNNEIAQAEAATGKQFVRYFMHGEFITVEGKRIGKSEGNAIRLYQLSERGFTPLAYRYLVLMAHYRSPMNFTWEALEAAKTALYRGLRMFADLPRGGKVDTDARARFQAALAEDLNAPAAVSVLWDVLKSADISDADKRETVLDFDRVLALGFSNPEGMEKIAVVGADALPAEATELLTQRETARKRGDFTEADRLRDQIQGMGYELTDTPEGAQLRKAGGAP